MTITDKDFSAEELMREVGEAMFNEEKKSRVALVRNMIMKQKGLSQEIERITKELEKKTKSMEDVTKKIEKFKNGDWSILKQFGSNKEDSNNQE